MQSKMRSASGSRKSRSRRNACSRRSRQRGDPQREPADVKPARNAGGQRAFLGGAAGVIGRGGAARSSREVLDEHLVGDIATSRYELHPCLREIGDACAFSAERRRSRRLSEGLLKKNSH